MACKVAEIVVAVKARTPRPQDARYVDGRKIEKNNRALHRRDDDVLRNAAIWVRLRCLQAQDVLGVAVQNRAPRDHGHEAYQPDQQEQTRRRFHPRIINTSASSSCPLEDGRDRRLLGRLLPDQYATLHKACCLAVYQMVAAAPLGSCTLSICSIPIFSSTLRDARLFSLTEPQTSSRPIRQAV